MTIKLVFVSLSFAGETLAFPGHTSLSGFMSTQKKKKNTAQDLATLLCD